MKKYEKKKKRNSESSVEVPDPELFLSDPEFSPSNPNPDLIIYTLSLKYIFNHLRENLYLYDIGTW